MPPPPRYGSPPGRRRPPKIVLVLTRRPLVAVLGLLLVVGIVVAGVLATSGSGKSYNSAAAFNDHLPGIVDRRSSFSVVNENRTGVPCAPTKPDRKRYVVHASLVAPASALATRPRAVVVLISGIIISGDHLWRVRIGGSTDLDFALAMALRGQAVVTVGMLGYHGSVTASGPNGNQVCAAAEADVIHQIVTQLRNGSFHYGNAATGPSFDRVALMAFSIGGEYAKVEAYTFHDIGGLVTVGSSPPNFVTPLAAKLAQSSVPDCRSQDRHKFANGSGPPGYTMANIPIAQKVLFYGPDRDPRDTQLLARGAETSPCGIFSSGLNLLKADRTGLAKINVPVLLTYGQHDGLVGIAGGAYQMRLLTGAKDRHLMIFPGSGHAWFLERQRARWTNMVVGWLETRGL